MAINLKLGSRPMKYLEHLWKDVNWLCKYKKEFIHKRKYFRFRMYKILGARIIFKHCRNGNRSATNFSTEKSWMLMIKILNDS